MIHVDRFKRFISCNSDYAFNWSQFDHLDKTDCNWNVHLAHSRIDWTGCVCSIVGLYNIHTPDTEFNVIYLVARWFIYTKFIVYYFSLYLCLSSTHSFKSIAVILWDLRAFVMSMWCVLLVMIEIMAWLG